MARDPTITHKIMSAVRSKNTRPELLLRKALWQKGLRYRVNYKALPGKPDVVFTKSKVAVFCDGDFWHGHNWALRGLPSFEEELKRYSSYWQEKLIRNVARDKEIDHQLETQGWCVVRIWESEIKNDLAACVAMVEDALFTARLEQWNLTREETYVFQDEAEVEEDSKLSFPSKAPIDTDR